MADHQGLSWDDAAEASSGIADADAIVVSVSLFDTAFPDGPAFGHVQRSTWQALTARFQQRRHGAKDGPAFVPARFRPEPDGSVRRVKDNLVARTVIALDIETNKKTGEVPPPFAVAVERVQAQGWAAAIYTSHNHTPAAPRYRIVIPLSDEIAPDLPAPEAAARLLDLWGVIDAGKIGAAALFYLPSTAPDAAGQHETAVIDGSPIDAAWITGQTRALLEQREQEWQRQRAVAMEAAARRREAKAAAGFDPNASIIEAVRDRLDLAAELGGHGYRPAGPDRFLFPGSESGIPGVYIMTGRDGVERVYSHHAADPLAAGNLPSWCRAKALDVVDVLIILDHGGDLKAGLRSLAQRFGINSVRQSQQSRTAQEDRPRPNGHWNPPPPQPEAEPAAPPPEPDQTAKPRGTLYGRLQVLGTADIDTAAPRSYLLKGLLSPAEISLWVGAPKCGKSFLLLHVAYLLSLGQPVFGRRVKPTKVLYVAAEGEAGIANRIKALRDKHGYSDNFHWIAQPADLLHDDSGHLGDLVAAAKAIGAQLIVLDTLSRLMAGGDENSPQDMGGFVRNVSDVRHLTGAHIAIVHHGTKASNGVTPRGHSSLTGADDALIEVVKQADGSRVATVVHAKDDADGMCWGFTLEAVGLGTDEDGDPITTLRVEEADEPPTGTPGQNGTNRLSDNLQIGLRTLHAAIKADAILATVGDDFTERSVVTENDWRVWFYREGKPGASQDTKKKTFQRIIDGLLARDLIGSRDGFVWPIQR